MSTTHAEKVVALEVRSVEPDIEVELLPADLAAGRDPVLQRAITDARPHTWGQDRGLKLVEESALGEANGLHFETKV